MGLEQFMNEAISPWLKEEGPDSDIVMSSRIRLARNLDGVSFPLIATEKQLEEILYFIEKEFNQQSLPSYSDFEFLRLSELKQIQKHALVEKHLISPHLIERSDNAAVLISKNEQVSIMVNEEDHIRTQLYFPGFQLERALRESFQIDDWLEEKLDFAFDENFGYLTTCPTNVGTGMRASVMMHLPALAITSRLNRMVPAINQIGLVVRGLYGEGSEARGNIFQISNQVTLGRSEEDIIDDLNGIVQKLIEQEREVRQNLVQETPIELENRIFRSLGTLKYSRIIESKEAAQCLSDVRLGIDLGFIKHIPRSILNELVVLTQPAFLQQYAKKRLSAGERDIFRASLIRERLTLEEKEE